MHIIKAVNTYAYVMHVRYTLRYTLNISDYSSLYVLIKL